VRDTFKGGTADSSLRSATAPRCCHAYAPCRPDARRRRCSGALLAGGKSAPSAAAARGPRDRQSFGAAVTATPSDHYVAEPSPDDRTWNFLALGSWHLRCSPPLHGE